MRECLREAALAAAEGEVPVGACVVREGEIVGRGRNRRERGKSALAHAEIEAIGAACAALGGWRLHECELYVTLEPCPMCAGAIVQARIPNVVFGTRNVKAGCAGSILNILNEPRFNHQVSITEGVLQEECAKPMGEFFKRFRKSNKNNPA